MENLCVDDAQMTLAGIHMIEMSARYRLICKIKPTAARLVKLEEHRSAEQEAVSSNPGQNNTWGLKIPEENVLPFL